LIKRLIDHPGPLWPLYGVWVWIFAALFSMVWGPYMLCLVAFGASRQRQTQAVRIWLGGITRVGRVSFDVRGRENQNPDEAALIVTNHQSLLDIPAAFEAFQGDIRMVAKASLFKIPIMGVVMKATEFIPLERGSQAAGKKASAEIERLIKSGVNVWVCPEGTRSEDGQIKDFKTGAFAIAIQTGVPVQPIVVKNSRETFAKSGFFIRPGKTIHVQVLPRVSTKGLRTEDRRALAEKVRNAMVEEIQRP